MKTKLSHTQLMVPVYINEKIVLDMLAIIEDGFSMVSQVNSSEQKESTSNQTGSANASTSLLNKLLKIDLKAEISHTGSVGESEDISREKVHTNVSLLSKFRTTLDEEKLLDTSSNISNMKIGSFIELDKIVDIFRMINIFSDEPALGNKKNTSIQKKKESQMIKQIKEFSDELKHSGTVDFILSGSTGTIVLSAQEQYLANDNISEILGGKFKVLGKVIAICKDDSESIDLLRKTTLSILTDEMLADIFAGFENEDMKQFNLPKLVTKIKGPAMIVIPIAIYA